MSIEYCIWAKAGAVRVLGGRNTRLDGQQKEDRSVSGASPSTWHGVGGCDGIALGKKPLPVGVWACSCRTAREKLMGAGVILIAVRAGDGYGKVGARVLASRSENGICQCGQRGWLWCG